MKWKQMFRSPKRRAAARFVRRGDAARDAGRFGEAGALYAQAVQLVPSLFGIHVQAGHMAKEMGEYEAAEAHYSNAAQLVPDDADLALQFGHLYKTWGRFDDAVGAYRRAAELAPGWAEPKAELGRMYRAGWREPDESFEPAPPLEDPYAVDVDRQVFDPKLAAAYGTMAAEQLPRPFRDMVRRSEPSLNIIQFGVVQNSFWGMRRVARGVEAIRGFCISTELLTDVTALVDGLVIHRGPVKGPYELEYEPDPTRIHKYVFNIWADFTGFSLGQHTLELRFRDCFLLTRTLHEDFVVEAPLTETDHPDSDAIINLAPGDTRSIVEQINSRPSRVHEAARPNMLPEIKSILVIRPDQLGDLVASIPGLFRLRELFPNAKLVGVCSRANVDLARSLEVFDDIIVANLRESMPLRTRTMTWSEQEELRDKLAAHEFDIAIDLPQSRMSRSLLSLSGAPFLYGFRDPDWPRLSASVDDDYYDPKSRREIAPHSSRILALIERLGVLMKSGAREIRRDDLSREHLAALGIGEHDRYAVLHMGARIIFSRWQHYIPLAERLHRETGLKIVIFTDGSNPREGLPADIATSDRFIVIDRQLPFDQFDALLSFCAIYVGNDSGPKHLAALRGVPVVSIHSARVSWNEWGQELSGVIVSRKVPCAGCSIYHDVDECGADFACVKMINLDDVYDAVRRYV